VKKPKNFARKKFHFQNMDNVTSVSSGFQRYMCIITVELFEHLNKTVQTIKLAYICMFV